MGKVLIACEESQEVMKAFLEKGHDAYSFDLQDCSGGIPERHIKADFRSVIQDTWDFVGYHYECRVMANSGVRWLYEIPGRWEELERACEVFNLTIRDTRPGYSENSIQHAHAKARIDREQDQVIQPWHFGHKKMKGTCIWVRDIPMLTPSKIVGPPPKDKEERRKWQDVWMAPPGPERSKTRSKTYPGIAKAMAEQWSPLIK